MMLGAEVMIRKELFPSHPFRDLGFQHMESITNGIMVLFGTDDLFENRGNNDLRVELSISSDTKINKMDNVLLNPLLDFRKLTTILQILGARAI